LVRALRPLGSWYVAARYPDVNEAAPERADVEIALQTAHALRRSVRELDPFED
jgi:hypothetical protein